MKKTNRPLISFVTPNYNDGDTIEKMVDSIMSQDWPNVEQIVVDDGSTDDSVKVLKKLEKKYSPKLKVILLKKNKGACVARNVGAKESKGKYLSFLPADAILYPGMARVWVETLERHPEYDFLYGGYKFVDARGQDVHSYMSDEFDPYFLKVTNYIDGSFPLKRELFDKMGGWDPAIKSLQDWDFWLNAVLNHKANGLYSKQEFFSTTLPHPGGLSDDSHRNWVERTTAIRKKYGMEIPKICVTGPGASFHAKNVAKIIGADYLPMPSFKPHNYEMIYVIGFFGNVAQAFHNTRAMRVVHWIGSDILQLQQADKKLQERVVDWLENNVDINLCEIEATQKELAEMGIKARIVPFPPQTMYKPMPLPKKPAVACYLPYNNANFYFPDFMQNVAKRMPKVDFHFFGNPMAQGSKLKNVFNYGYCNKEEMAELVEKTSLIVRLTPHDGLPLSVVEWIMAGRRAITTIDIPYAKHFKMKQYTKQKPPTDKELNKIIRENETELIKMIKEVELDGDNLAGSKYYTELCDEKRFKDTINSFLKFDMKRWWKVMSEIWPSQEATQETTEDVAKILKEIRKLDPKSVLDLGCGTGRWIDLMNTKNYTGIDFSNKLIKEAKKNHPDGNFVETDIVSYSKKAKTKFDLVFSFASLLHILPEDMEKTAKAIKKLGKVGLFIEPVKEQTYQSTSRTIHPEIKRLQKETDFIFNVKYTFIHDYLKHFHCTKVVPLSHNRNLFVVDLTK